MISLNTLNFLLYLCPLILKTTKKMEVNISLFDTGKKDLYSIGLKPQFFKVYESIPGYNLTPEEQVEGIEQLLEEGQTQKAVFLAALNFFKVNGTESFAKNSNSMLLFLQKIDGVSILTYIPITYQGDTEGCNEYCTEFITDAITQMVVEKILG